MKQTITLVLALQLLTSTFLLGQNTSMAMQLEQLGGATEMTWVTQRFLVHKNYNLLHTGFGLETQSAIGGKYGGFYVFGLHGQVSLDFPVLQLQTGLTLATGGGAGAPDGDGLMYRWESGIGARVHSNAKVLLTYSLLDFPSGEIKSSHPGLQLVLNLPYRWQPENQIDLRPGAISVLSSIMLFDSEDASNITTYGQSLYTGVRFSQEIYENLDLDLQLGASALGETDGFMDYKAGLTYVPGKGNIQPLLRGQIGSGGGGSVLTAGGFAIYGGGGFRILNKIELSLNYWKSTGSAMGAPVIELSYRAPFNSNFGFVHSGNTGVYQKEVLKSTPLTLVIGSRVNLASGVDRNGLDYNPMGSIFMGAKLPVTKGVFLSGETLWAATGGYGAYAEGMFGIYQDLIDKGRVKIGWNSSVVAAGGGGIETNNGLALAYGMHLSIENSIKNRWTFIARQKYFGQGAYNPLVLGVQYEPTFKIFTR